MEKEASSATKDVADLISAIADLISAISWPVILLFFLLVFRKEIYKSILSLFGKIDGATSLKTPLFQIDFVQTELGAVAAKAGPGSGEVTKEQVEASARIEARVDDIDRKVLIDEMNKLCIEYERTRESMPSSPERTQIMNQIMARMRALGPSISDNVFEFQASASEGRRLAAVAIMQMVPGRADIAWLLGRFSQEKPFIFYHAALALQNLARSSDISRSSLAKSAASKALDIINSFEGPKDRNSITVLESVVNYR